MLRVLYLVHDLSDPAVRRRVMMLEAGGAEVTLAGFRRSNDIPSDLAKLEPVDLGHTADGRFAQRLMAVARASASLGPKLRSIPRPDIIMGRNLEMLALAVRARSLFSANIPIVYECLDIHRLLLGNGGVSRTIRKAEHMLGRNASLLITSSPSFVRHYFHRFGQIDAPIMLMHNKVLELTDPAGVAKHSQPLAKLGPPWTIGWFGALRCRKSLMLLSQFTRRTDGRFEITLRGRPAYTEFPEFNDFVAGEPFMRFEGAYRNPEDLANIYSAVHFSWAIDFFEEGLNSSWLLPNRLFEGCRHGAVPIAMKDTETGRFLSGKNMGVLLDEASPSGLVEHLASLEPDTYQRMRTRIMTEDQSTWVCDLHDCRALVERLAALPSDRHSEIVLQAA